ncbi:hypothetical protein K469DRAFT_784881 [Zopfia rhizophila CBS 207.26]|uniref:Uncharacterized protein n=1 Tax=Zopfia rhizophila CBS 207.26 TaxID=1314779 RepID=A0A6A6E0A5_9PEZI|nr:hypothetical protein K469DRAFT_784881 [Zopfia rhizophila CBS 207.26]
MRLCGSDEEQEDHDDTTSSQDSDSQSDDNRSNKRKRATSGVPQRGTRRKINNEAPVDEEPILPKVHIPRGLIKPDTVWKALPSSKNLKLLTRLFYAIASADAVRQLRDSFQVTRGEQKDASLSSPDTIAGLVRSLDMLDTCAITSAILRRYQLIRLVEYRETLLKEMVLKRRRAVATVNGALDRIDSQVLTKLLADAYPHLKQQGRISQASDEYQRLHSKMKNRLKLGQNWYALSTRFGSPVLALVPTGDDVHITSTEADFEKFLALLDENRGANLRLISKSITP